MVSMRALPSISRIWRQLFIGLLLVIGANPAAAEVRALILSADYVGAMDPGMRLSNPVVDGRAMAQALRKAGVKDLKLAEEAPADRWQSEFQAFTNRLSPDDIALVYYAGHGFQIGGRNYLVTADGNTLIALDEVMKQLTARAKGTIMIIDACRENPLQAVPESLAVRSIGTSRSIETVRMSEIEWKSKGLAQLGDLRGLSAIVLFSTGQCRARRRRGPRQPLRQAGGARTGPAPVARQRVPAHRRRGQQGDRRPAIAVAAGRFAVRRLPRRNGGLPGPLIAGRFVAALGRAGRTIGERPGLRVRDLVQSKLAVAIGLAQRRARVLDRNQDAVFAIANLGEDLALPEPGAEPIGAAAEADFLPGAAEQLCAGGRGGDGRRLGAAGGQGQQQGRDGQTHHAMVLAAAMTIRKALVGAY